MARHPGYERWLEQRGVRWHYNPSVPLRWIDKARSLQNKARTAEGVPVKPDLAEQYALALMDGAQFPALVAYEHAPDRYTLITGNHRMAAAEMADVLVWDLYVVEAPDEATIDVLTRTINFIEGNRGSRDEALAQAIHLVQERGYEQKDAAAMCQVPRNTLSGQIARLRTDRRLESIGREPTSLHPSTRVRLGAIPNNAALAAAADFVKEHQIGGDLLNELTKAVIAERTESDQLGVIRQWESRPDMVARRTKTERGKRKVAPTRDDMLLSLLQRLMGHMSRTGPGSRAAGSQRQVLAETWHRVSTIMAEYLGEVPNGRPRAEAPTTAR